MARTNKAIILIGARGTGKTDYLKKMAFKMTNLFPKTLVVDTFDSDVWHNLKTHDQPENINFSVPIVPLDKFHLWKSGIGRVFSSDTDHLMQIIEEYARNTFIIFEDATKYIEKTLTKKQKKFVLDSKQKNLDLVFVFHSLMAVPPDLLRISDIVILFKTNDAELPKKFNQWPELNDMMKTIKESKNRYINLSIQLN